MSAYGGMKFDQQAAIMKATVPLADVAKQAAEMWQKAKTQLTGASASLQQQLKALEPDWTDEAGGRMQQRGGRSAADIDSWTTGIDQAVSALGELAGAITRTGAWFEDMAKLLEGNPLAELLKQQLAPLGGQQLDTLAKQFEGATQAVRSTKGNDWSGPLGSGGGGSGSSGGGSGSAGGAAGGGQQGQSGSSSGAGQGGGAQGEGQSGDQPGGQPGDQSGGLPGDQSGGLPGDQPRQPGDPQVPYPGEGPSLSGLGGAAAPVAPPALPPLPPLSVPPSLPGGMPLPMGGLGGFGGGVPGVKLGGGGPKPPQPAFPVSQQAATLSSGQAPKLPEAGPPPPPGGNGGGGMPIAPMSGLGGLSGGGGTPGSGAAQRPPSGRGPRRTNPPGLPAALRGKSGRTDPSAFAPLARPSRRERADDRTTVEVLDDDLWQVTGSGAGQPTPPGRLAR
ncbi:WXG100 family type VII secretion target [Amycolatopsis sp. WGS_07]|uniref:WXG100 family type VII secretion target n=1 Tax=Amycolatopsis sp. WGS_07 TaxID=3076764 RepID=UPI0038734320